MDRNKQWQIFQITNQIWMIFVPAIAVSIRQGHVGIVPPKEKFHLLGAPNKDISRMHPPCGYMYIYLYIYVSIYLSIYLYLKNNISFIYHLYINIINYIYIHCMHVCTQVCNLAEL